MRKKIMVLPLAMFLLAIATQASGQNRAKAVTLSPFVGGYMFECFQRLDNNWYYGLRLGYNFTPHWGIEGMGGYVPTEGDFDENVNVWRYAGELQYNFFPNTRFVPFVAIGGGGVQINDSPGPNDHERAMFDYGVGLKIYVTRSLALRADVRHDLFCEFNDVCSNLEYTGGLTFQFGGKARAVAATPPIEEEAAPAPAPVVADTECSTYPANGATNVSVAAIITAKLNGQISKGFLKVQRPDGSRVKGLVAYDNDSRIATFSPEVPFAPNTTYTVTIDNEAETFSQSCLFSFTTAPIVLIELDDTHFAHDSSAITPAGIGILDENIRTLKANPKLRVLVAGYTSASGTTEYNQKLSEQRANAVRNYMIAGGIAPDRLVQIGYGETRPAEYEPVVNDIESRAAKANRRVLFTIIVK